MKKILLVALAAAAMVGCSQNEEIDNAAQKVEINFAPVVKVGTKAVVSTTTNLTEFSVNGYSTADDMGGAVVLTDYTGKLTVTGSSTTKWDANKTIYWPAKDKMQFFATSPAQTLTATSGYPTFTYTVGAMADQKDLIVASVYNAVKSKTDVAFTFQHFLTQVNFSISGDTKDCVYEVTKLELVKIADTSTFTFAATNVGDWSTPTGDATYSWEGNKTVTPSDALTETTSILVGQDNALFMLMPQTLGADAALKVTYSATPKDSKGASFDGTKTVSLKDIVWSKNQSVKYTLKLSSDATAIGYSATVGDWLNSGDSDLDPKE